MGDFARRIDAISLASLRETGATKWSSDDGAIGAFVAEMDFGVDPRIAAALHRAIDEGMFGYLPGRLGTGLADAVSAYVGDQYGWSVESPDVKPISDVIAAFQFALARRLVPGEKLIVPTPSYMPFLRVAHMAGVEVIEMPLSIVDGRYEFDLTALEGAFASGGRLLVLSNPFNPVGRVFSAAELRDISEIVERHDGSVFSDEIWAPLVYPGHTHVPYASVSRASATHTLTAMSASKAWNLPGLKCAQLVLSNDRDREDWDRFGSSVRGPSNLGVIANTVAFRDGGEWLADTLDYLTGNRDRLIDLLGTELPSLWMPIPEGTYVGWIDFRSLNLGESPADFFTREAGVKLTDGSSCGAAGIGYARLIFGTPRPILERIVKQLAAAVRRQAPTSSGVG